MHLCIDIGNTKVKWGIVRRDSSPEAPWLVLESKKNLSLSSLEAMIDKYGVEAAIVSNTRDDLETLRPALEALPFFVAFDEKTPIPVRNHYETPSTLGKDRIAAVCGAIALYPGEDLLVIDAGTCITMDRITSEGDYFGGSIHPGISMRYKALSNYTGKLPLVNRQDDCALVGTSTEGAIRAGVQYAILQEIEGMIRSYNVNYGELKVIISGGDSPFFVSHLKSKIFAHSNLVLTGLNKILNYNVERL